MKNLLFLLVGLLAITSQAADLVVKKVDVTSHIQEGVQVSQLVGRQLDDYAEIENISQFVVRSKVEISLNDMTNALTKKMGSEVSRGLYSFCKHSLNTKDVKSCLAQLIADSSLSVQDTSKLFFENYLGSNIDSTAHILSEETDGDYNVERAVNSLLALEKFIKNIKSNAKHMFVIDMAKGPNVDYSMVVAIKYSKDKKSTIITLISANCGA